MLIHEAGLELSDQEDLAAMCSRVKSLPHLQVQYFTCHKHLDLAADSSSSPLAGKTPHFGPNIPVSSLPSCVVRGFWFKD